MLSKLEAVLGAVEIRHESMSGWTWGIDVHPKWHRSDRMWIRDAAGHTVCEAHFRIRKDGTGLSFHKGDEHWHEVVMDGWDDRAAASCLLVCVFWHAVPGGEHRAALAGGIYDPVLEPGPLSSVELKPLQHAVRKSKTGWRSNAVWPPAVAAPLLLLQRRHDQLSGADVEEGIRKLEIPFRFLISKGVPFERVRRAWAEAEVAEVMDA